MTLVEIMLALVAILGAPLLLTTLAMFVVGAAALGYGGRRRTGTALNVDEETIGRESGLFPRRVRPGRRGPAFWTCRSC